MKTDPYILIGIIGSIASIASLAISAPTMKSKIVHIIYSIVLSAVVGGSLIYHQNWEDRLTEANIKATEIQLQLNEMKSIRQQAFDLSQVYRNRSNDIGENRGIILAAFSFLEINKDVFPESFQIAKNMVIDGLKITESMGSIGSEGYYDEQKRMEDGANAMRSILKGISVTGGS